ncbi:expressed unknown protein [Seminavis robusta]|uniref:Uncharacterized protein n=1 Tax=Seminavis robusta TaxID=568900 RepID=A0A9N8ELZ1_9STRA|nr:expressed unknown protein [Seminavis robusta]|eukprot:Sro1442_g273010.1 n/a (400) ;mRNA; r:2949-4148
MNPRLARAFYRSYLRLSQKGHHPQIFGRYGAAVFAQQSDQLNEHASLALPSSPAQVRNRLKQWFRSDEKPLDNDTATCAVLQEMAQNPLDVFRRIHENQNMLPNTLSGAQLPIFDYDGMAALPGERFQTLFLEPRYVHGLLPLVLASSNQHFLLRPHRQASTGTLLKLVSHQHVHLPACTIGKTMTNQEQPSSNDTAESKTNDDQSSQLQEPEKRRIAGVAVTCAAGSLVRIEEEEQIDGLSEYMQLYAGALLHRNKTGEEQPLEDDPECWSTSKAPLALATHCSHHYDDRDWMTSDHEAETRQYILHLLQCVLAYHDTDFAETLVQTGFGLPPLDAQAFSFWALRFVLRQDDVEGRLHWQQDCHSIRQRLEFVLQEAEAILDAQQEEEEEEMVGARFG